MGEKFTHICSEVRTAFDAASYLPYVDADHGGIGWHSIDSVSDGVAQSVTSGTIRSVLKELMDEGVSLAPDALAGLDPDVSVEDLLRQLVSASVAHELRSTDEALSQEEKARYMSFQSLKKHLETMRQAPQANSRMPIPKLTSAPVTPTIFENLPSDNGHEAPQLQRIVEK